MFKQVELTLLTILIDDNLSQLLPFDKPFVPKQCLSEQKIISHLEKL